MWELMNPARQEFLRRLSAYAIEARYPEGKARLSRDCDAVEAKKILDEAGEVVEWLRMKCEERLSRATP